MKCYLCSPNTVHSTRLKDLVSKFLYGAEFMSSNTTMYHTIVGRLYIVFTCNRAVRLDFSVVILEI